MSHDALAAWGRIESWLKVNTPNSYLVAGATISGAFVDDRRECVELGP
ncbi:hypothetical protein [Streptomyces sp. NPDC056291]